VRQSPTHLNDFFSLNWIDVFKHSNVEASMASCLYYKDFKDWLASRSNQDPLSFIMSLMYHCVGSSSELLWEQLLKCCESTCPYSPWPKGYQWPMLVWLPCMLGKISSWRGVYPFINRQLQFEFDCIKNLKMGVAYHVSLYATQTLTNRNLTI